MFAQSDVSKRREKQNCKAAGEDTVNSPFGNVCCHQGELRPAVQRGSPVRLCVVCAELLPEDSVSARRGQEAARSRRPSSQLHILHLNGHLLLLRYARRQRDGGAARCRLRVGWESDPRQACGGRAAALPLVHWRGTVLVLHR